MEHLFPYRWSKEGGFPAPGIQANGLKVFGTFICGGGSTMGYKLAGCTHLGGVEIDERVAKVYQDNLQPKYLYVEDLRKFNQREDLPDELYQLDILDGSPPCSTFSMAGNRERAWGKEKRFAEGQALQTLDDLVFVYCDTIAKLKPKTFILENVKGLALGNAKSYLRRIYDRLKTIGYDCQVFILNAASMGVPQIRERTIVVGRRRDLGLNAVRLDFREKPVYFGEIIDRSDKVETLKGEMRAAWDAWRVCDRSLSQTNIRTKGKWTGYTTCWIREDRVANTLTTGQHLLTSIPRDLNEKELLDISTFPQDYKYGTKSQLRFLTGMSVPPVMMAQIAHQMAVQIFGK